MNGWISFLLNYIIFGVGFAYRKIAQGIIIKIRRIYDISSNCCGWRLKWGSIATASNADQNFDVIRVGFRNPEMRDANFIACFQFIILGCTEKLISLKKVSSPT